MVLHNLILDVQEVAKRSCQCQIHSESVSDFSSCCTVMSSSFLDLRRFTFPWLTTLALNTIKLTSPAQNLNSGIKGIKRVLMPPQRHYYSAESSIEISTFLMCISTLIVVVSGSVGETALVHTPVPEVSRLALSARLFSANSETSIATWCWFILFSLLLTALCMPRPLLAVTTYCRFWLFLFYSAC
jgi:hypothetical protein